VITVAPAIVRGAPIEISGLRWPQRGRQLEAEASSEANVASLCLEIAPTRLAVKAVLASEPTPYALAEAKALHGLDFGYGNTATLSSVAVDPARLRDPDEIAKLTKAQARKYLAEHVSDVEPTLIARHGGENFLTAVTGHAGHIDVLKSEIDRAYNRLHKIKAVVCDRLGFSAETRLDSSASDPLIPRFFRLLEAITRLKAKRRDLYRKIAAIKKTWFGWITSRIAAQARQAPHESPHFIRFGTPGLTSCFD